MQYDCNSLRYAICTLFAFGDLCLLYIWTHKKAGYMRVHAGYVICQNDIFSNSSVVGHIFIFTANSCTQEFMIGLQK